MARLCVSLLAALWWWWFVVAPTGVDAAAAVSTLALLKMRHAERTAMKSQAISDGEFAVAKLNQQIAVKLSKLIDLFQEGEVEDLVVYDNAALVHPLTSLTSLTSLAKNKTTSDESDDERMLP